MDSRNPNELDDPMDEALAEYLVRVDRGEVVDRREFIATHPEVAGALEDYFATSEAVVQALRETDDRAEPTLALPVVLGDYELLARLGSGGMGTVYKARHIRLSRWVAVKVLPEDRLLRPEALARFQREMLAAGNLDHPNIVQAYDAREVDGTHFLVMEFVEGQDLDKLVKRCGPLPVADACEVIRQAALGLEHIRKSGMVHRDIKPSNLMLNERGQVKILDLGLARLREGLGVAGEPTSDSRMLGTVDYMAPEQASDTHGADIRADVYSLGCTLYKLLTGQPPFAAPKYSTLMQKIVAHARDRAAPVRDLRPAAPEALAAVLDRMLAKEPAERFADPAELIQAIEPFCAGADLARLLEVAQKVAVAAHDPQWVLESASWQTASASKSTVPMVPALPAPLARRRKTLGVAVGLLLLAIGVAFAIIIRVRDRSGRETVVPVPEGSTITIESQEEVVKPAISARQETAKPSQKPTELNGQPTDIRAPWTPTILPQVGTRKAEAPLSGMAWIVRPARIAAVLSWTLDTREHRGVIQSLAYSPDGRFLVSGGEDGSLRLWDAKDMKLRRILYGHDDVLWCVAWSPDGRYLASGSEDGTTRIWEAASGALLRVFQEHQGPVRAVAWSPDGRTIVSGGADKTLWFLELPAGRSLANVKLDHAVFSLAWSPDGKYIASGGEGKSVELRESGSKNVTRTFQHDEIVLRLAVSPRADIVAALDLGGALCLWDIASGRRVHPSLNLGSSQRFRVTRLTGGLAFSPDGRQLAFGGADQSIGVLEIPSAQTTLKIQEHTGPISAVAWSPDGKTIASSSDEPDGSLRLWDVNAGTSRQLAAGYRPHQSPCCLGWSPDGQSVALGDGKTIWRWRPASREPPLRIYGCTAYHSFQWSGDGTLLVLGPIKGPEQLGVNQPPRVINTVLSLDPKDYAIAVYSPDGSLLGLIDGHEKAVRLIAVPSGKELHVFKSGSEEPRQIVFSPDSKTLAVSAFVSPVFLWNTRSGKLLGRIKNENAANAGLGTVAWSPDGKMLAANSPWGVVTYSAPTGESARFFGRESPRVQHSPIAWSADGRTLISHWDYERPGMQMAWWDFESGRRTVTSTPSFTACRPVAYAFSPGGRLVAMTTPPGAPAAVLPIWELPNHRLRAIAMSFECGGRVLWVVPSAEGHYCAFGDLQNDFVYVVRAEAGQELLAPAEFARRYGWENDPSRVLSMGDTPAPAEPLVVGKAVRPRRVSVPKIAAEPLAVAERKPMSPLALVGRPAKIPGIKSWTIDTRGHRGPVESLSYSPDGRYLASASQDDAVRVWDATGGTLLHILAGAGPGITWSPDAGLLATSAPDNSIKIWDAKKGKTLRTIAAHFRARSLDWSPDGKLLAAEMPGENVEVWDLETGDRTDILAKTQAACVGIGLLNPPHVKWSPDGSVLAIVGQPERIQRWDRKSGKLLADIALPRYPPDRSLFVNVAWLPDSKLILSGSHGVYPEGVVEIAPKVRVWNCQTGQLKQEFDGNAGFCLPEDKIIVARWTGNAVYLVDGESQREICENSVLPYQPLSITSCPERRLAAVGWSDGTIRVLDLSTRRLRMSSPPGHVRLAEYNWVNWSLDHRRLLVGVLSGTRPFDLTTTEQLCSRYFDLRYPVWSPDGRLFTSGAGEISIIEARSGSQLATIKGEMSAWSPDGRKLAVAEKDRIVLWDVDSGKTLRTIQVGNYTLMCVDSLAWSPDGKQLAGARDRVLIWDAESGAIVREMPILGTILNLSWSPDGKSLAVISTYMNAISIGLFDALTRDLLDTLRPNQGEIKGLQWSPDGKRLTTAGSDRTLKEWDLETGQATVVATAPASDAFSPDLEYVAENCRTFVRLWETASGRLRGAVMPLHEGHYLVVSPEGHYRGSPGVQRKIIYVALTDSDEQQFFTPEEFARRFRWQNDPAKVRLVDRE